MTDSHHLDQLAAGVRAGDRALLARALTLVESRRPEHQRLAQGLLARLLPVTDSAVRVGISGPPGAGKSTLIESLGMRLVNAGERVAVLAVDPSSRVTGGSILGDKTRMVELSRHPGAFVRPTPSGGSLGGVAARTGEAVMLLEAAGFGVVLIETVGVGQSEAAVADLVDTFVVLLAPGGGDELQGIKRGILELAHVVAINKADGESRPAAERARRDFAAASSLLHPPGAGWSPPVLALSALEGTGVAELWEAVEEHRASLESSGALGKRRREQRLGWMWRRVEEGLMAALRRHPEVRRVLPEVERRVREGTTTPALAAGELLAALGLDLPQDLR